MTKQQTIVIGTMTLEEYPELDFEEVCSALNIDSHFIHELIEYGIIESQEIPLQSWRFNLNHLRRIRTAKRMQHDLEVNLAGVALAFQLMDELEELRGRLLILEKHLSSR